jgi:hypothetical protein
VPNGGVGRSHRSLRGLRADALRPLFLSQSPLPEVSGAGPRRLADRQAELLPAPYFHVVFTVPAPVADIAFQNKATVYAILFRAAAETLRLIAVDPKHFGAEIGLVAVLHTWGQTLHHHPHVHCVVPGGGLSLDGTRWVSCRPGFFLPVHVLSRLFHSNHQGVINIHFDDRVLPMTLTEWNAVTYFN